MQTGYTTEYYFYNCADTEKPPNFLKKLIVCISEHLTIQGLQSPRQHTFQIFLINLHNVMAREDGQSSAVLDCSP